MNVEKTNSERDELRKKVLEAADIVRTISQYIELKRSGNDYKGVCPFHPDSDPSLSVSTTKKIFKCFPCGVGGDVIKFVSEYEKISFFEALKKLAEANQIPFQYSQRKVSEEEKFALRIINLNDVVLAYFKYLMSANQTSEIKDYLKKRNLDEQKLQTYEIGWGGPEEFNMHDYLIKKGFSEQEISAAHVLRRDNKTCIFARRLIFPVRNRANNLVAFCGRAIEQNDVKYLNSSNTPVFVKSEVCYLENTLRNYRLAKYLIICEGFMDAIALKNERIPVIATMGTNLSANMAKFIGENYKKVIMAFDNDRAGKSASSSIAAKLYNYGIQVLTISHLLKDTKDFDELINLKKETLDYETQAIDYLELNISELKVIVETDPWKAEEKSSEIKQLINNIKLPITKSVFEKKLSQVTKVTVQNNYSNPIPRTNYKFTPRTERNVDKPLKTNYENLSDLNPSIRAELMVIAEVAYNDQRIVSYYEEHLGSLTTPQLEEFMNLIIVKKFEPDYNEDFFKKMLTIAAIDNLYKIEILKHYDLLTLEKRDYLSAVKSIKECAHLILGIKN